MRRAGMLRRSRKHDVRNVSLDAVGETGSIKGSGSSAAQTKVDAKIDLTTMLAALSAEHRQVIILRELQQLSYEQMAETLGVPRGTVESRLHRAREELRKKFGALD
jgi:RNA polymerase sigma-70 factor (ECF subfamily)